MNLCKRPLVVAGAAVLISAAVGASAGAGAGEEPGRAAFADLKCNVCHAVETAGIEAKTKNEKLLGPELSAALRERERGVIERFLHQEERLDGERHKKEFKGTDEELQAILDWLFEQAAEAAATKPAGS